MLVPSRINWNAPFNGLLALLSVCGFCPTRIDGKGTKLQIWNVILMTWSILHLVLATLLGAVAYQAFVDDNSDISSFNNVLKFSVTALTYFVTCVESIAVRKNFIEIWIRIRLIDDLIGNMLQDYESILNKFYKETVLKIVAYMFFTTAIEVLVITNVYELESWRLMWSLLIIPVTMSRFRHLHHTLFIEMLSCRFRVIKNELKSIVEFTKLDSNKLMAKNFVFYEGLFKKLSTIKSVYNTLWETSLLINRSFGVSQLINLLQNFVQLTCDLYLVYSFLYKNNLTYILGNHLFTVLLNFPKLHDKIFFLELMLQLFPTITVLVLVLNACEECLEQVRYIGFLLHNIEKDVEDQRINTLTENFSLQILHEPLMFSVSGFFKMDFMFLKAIIASITSESASCSLEKSINAFSYVQAYMVIFIQFMPKEKLDSNGTTVAETTTQIGITTL